MGFLKFAKKFSIFQRFIVLNVSCITICVPHSFITNHCKRNADAL